MAKNLKYCLSILLTFSILFVLVYHYEIIAQKVTNKPLLTEKVTNKPLLSKKVTNKPLLSEKVFDNNQRKNTNFVTLTEKIPTNLSTKSMCKKAILSSTSSEPIPKILHFVYKSTRLPEPYVKIITKCVEMNKDYQVILWTDQIAGEMIKRIYPSNIYQKYKKYTVPLEIADVTRLFVVHAFGGVYMDLDIECYRPLDLAEITKNNNISCLFNEEPPIQTRILHGRPSLVQNNAIVCQRNHTFLSFLIERLNPESQQWVISKTGPFFVSNILPQYHNSGRPVKEQMTLANPELFNPVLDDLNVGNYCKNRPSSTDCSQFKTVFRGPTKLTFAIHRYLKMGYTNAKDQLPHTDVCKTLPTLTTYQPDT